jgi:hypothetical protein
MMEKLTIAATINTPGVNFDHITNMLTISGRSTHVHLSPFYQKLNEWLDEYKKSWHIRYPTLTIIFEYFNCQTARYLTGIFNKLVEIDMSGHGVSVMWIYEASNTDMLEAGKMYADIIPLPFSFISLSSNN